MIKKYIPILIFLFSFTTLATCKEKSPTWGEIYSKKTSAAKGWKYIVIHHSGTNAGSAAAFHRYHTKKGYGGLCYHFVIGNGKGTKDGKIETGFRWKEQIIGTHVNVQSWYHNIFGIGICLVGNFQKNKPTRKQLKSLNRLIKILAKKYNIPHSNILGHREVPIGQIEWDSKRIHVKYKKGRYAQTSCPGRKFNMVKLRNGIR